MGNFFEELKNRNVYKVATAYAISGWLIMQVLNTLGDNLMWPNVIVATITKILIVGFPIALVFAWLYEFTPQGLIRTGAVQLDTVDNKKVGRHLNHIIIAVLAITISFMLAERVFFAGNTSINDRMKASIAVLPFVNMSSSEENDSFADGLTEQILNDLAQLSGMQVTARTSSFKFKGKNEDIRTIAEQLSVNYVLEGSIQYDAPRNRIKITTQLINASNGYHLWSETYEDDFDEIFTIQENVSRKVASQLSVQLLEEEDLVLATKLTDNTDAYKLYILSREYSKKRTDRDLEKGIDLLKQALELDPNFAEAHAELAFLYPQRHFYGNFSKDDRDSLQVYHLNKAIKLAPNKPEVLRAKALNIMQVRGDSSSAIADLRKAVKIKPNYADGHYMLYNALWWAEQPQTAIKSLEKAVELDPLNFFAEMLAQAYFRSFNEHEKGLAILNNLIAVDSPGTALRRKSTFVAIEPQGDLVHAFKLIHEAEKQDPHVMGNYNFHTIFSLDLDLTPVSEKYAEGLKMRYPNNEHHTFNNIAYLYLFNKNYNKLIEWIEFWASEKNLDIKREGEWRSDYHVALGQYSKALQIFEESFPEISQHTIKADDLDAGLAYELVLYTELLRLNKADQKANYLSKQLCKYYNTHIVNNVQFGASYKNDMLLDCYYLSNDSISFIKTLEDRFFVKKNRKDVFGNIKAGWYKRFKDHPGFRSLSSRITQETHRMRAEVITYLKEEGDWDPAWDKEMGLE